MRAFPALNLPQSFACGAKDIEWVNASIVPLLEGGAPATPRTRVVPGAAGAPPSNSIMNAWGSQRHYRLEFGTRPR